MQYSARQDFGFIRVAVCSPALRVADVEYNISQICQAMDAAYRQQVNLLVFPELCITAYSCGDLHYQRLLLDRALQGLCAIARYQNAHQYRMDLIVGLPLLLNGKLFNCAAFLNDGNIVGIVPKTFLPGTGEFYEERWFSSAFDATGVSIPINGRDVAFGADLLFTAPSMPEYCIGIEICEDLWAAVPPSCHYALHGATILANLSASNEILGKREYRHTLVQAHSARCLAAYCYAAAGPGESTTDLVFSGHSLIAENNRLMAETTRFCFETQMALADVDVQRMTAERLKNNTFGLSQPLKPCRVINISEPAKYTADPTQPLLRYLSESPFVPKNPALRSENCHEIFDIQTTGLAKRLIHTGTKTVVLGVSGGLDSTLALLVCAKAFDNLGWARSGIHALTMPGFGTTDRTRTNAERLAELLGTTLRIIPINAAVQQHFADIGHDESQHDVTYENAQARERTQILMDVANQVGGLVLGTGDLSELALGWCTYNADQMSMYHVNAGIPKTLVRFLVEWCAETEFAGAETSVLFDICNTPVSPELLPLNGNEQVQETEKTIGPYLLHDFFLYFTVRFQFAPQKIWYLALIAFSDKYTAQEILHWMTVFYRRFFSQQFKRSAMPDGPKVGTVALSPRGDWRMPSDAQSALWMQEIETLHAQFFTT